MVKCQACNRKAESESKGFCKYHQIAYESLKLNYDAWCNAYDELLWKEYLERLLKSKETGSWIKDVIKLKLEENKKL